MTYHVEYEGYYTMSWHDREENALKRWFDNFKIDRWAHFATDTECLIVEEVASETRRKKRYVCKIEDEGRGIKREVIMDHTAPPAPILTFASKRRYEPPPPKTAAELRKEAEWSRMMSMGYEPIRRPRYRPATALWAMDMADGPSMSGTFEVEYDIEWVRRRPQYYDGPRADYTPPPVRHRRNA